MFFIYVWEKDCPVRPATSSHRYGSVLGGFTALLWKSALASLHGDQLGA